MTPLSHFPPVFDPVDGTGHYEDGTAYADGRIVPVRKFVKHCQFHPYIEMRGLATCERCANEPEPEYRP